MQIADITSLALYTMKFTFHIPSPSPQASVFGKIATLLQILREVWSERWIFSCRMEISHNILEYVKFPTNRIFHRNFSISTWENFRGNLTCMLEWNCYLTSIHENHSFHLRQCTKNVCVLLMSFKIFKRITILKWRTRFCEVFYQGHTHTISGCLVNKRKKLIDCRLKKESIPC